MPYKDVIWRLVISTVRDSVFRIPYPYSAFTVWDRFRIPYSVSVFRI